MDPKQSAENARVEVGKDELLHLMWPYASLEDTDHMCTVFDHCRWEWVNPRWKARWRSLKPLDTATCQWAYDQ
jgi:hypothetical protein